MSSNDGPANPTESAELSPEQLQLRLAQAQAEAEAARLQVEVLKLQAQLADTKGTPAASSEPQTKSPATDRWNRGPTSRGPDGPAKSPPPLPAGKVDAPQGEKNNDNSRRTGKATAGAAVAGAAAASTAASAKSPISKPAGRSRETSPPAPAEEKPAPAAKLHAVGAVAAAPAAVPTVPLTRPVPPSPTTSPATPQPPADYQAEPANDTVAGSVAEDVADDDEYEEEIDRRGWARLMLAAPSWLVSLLFHLAVLLAAALLSFSVEDTAPKRILIAETAEEEDEVLEEVVIEKQDDLEDVEMDAIPTPDINPGAMDFGDIAGADLPASNVSIGLDTTDAQMVEVGALFGTGGQGMAAYGEGMSGSFFNVKATGTRFAFVVDSSLSMKAGKFEAACQELYYAASRLSDEQAFYVLFFDWDAARMFDQENPEPRMVRATPENLQRLQAWMKGVELELKTNPYDAMEFAMKLMPDAIYVLSDGAFTDGGRTVKWLKKVNLVEDEIDGTKPIVTVHTIGFYTEDNGTLKQMAETYGGTYRFVPKPPNFKKGPAGGGPRRKRP